MHSRRLGYPATLSKHVQHTVRRQEVERCLHFQSYEKIQEYGMQRRMHGLCQYPVPKISAPPREAVGLN